MRRNTSIAISLAFFFGLIISAQLGTASQDEWEKVLSKAKQEGRALWAP